MVLFLVTHLFVFSVGELYFVAKIICCRVFTADRLAVNQFDYGYCWLFYKQSINFTVLDESGTPYTQQSYKVSESFPFKWINKKWKEGFHVTSMTTAGSRWGVVMSRNAGYAEQVKLFSFSCHFTAFLEFLNNSGLKKMTL